MCIINHTHKFIFIHVPKTAGTTIAQHFSRFSTYRDIEIGATEMGQAIAPFYSKRYGLAKHSTLGEIAQIIGDANIHQFTTFGFVRNPYDRAVSMFTFLKRQQKRGDHKDIAEHDDVNDFIKSDYFAKDGVNRIHKPQDFWLTYSRSRFSKTADFIGRVEDIDNDIQIIYESVGLKKPENSMLPHKNISKNRFEDINLELNTESIGIINKKYSIDFKKYDYEQI